MTATNDDFHESCKKLATIDVFSEHTLLSLSCNIVLQSRANALSAIRDRLLANEKLSNG